MAGGGQNARATMAAVFCMVAAKHFIPDSYVPS